MGELKVSLDLSPLSQYLENFVKEISKDVSKGVKGLTEATNAHIKERAQQELHSFRDEYIQNLSFKQLDTYLWEITLNADAAWIEEGREKWDMKIGLLGTKREGSTGRIETVKSGPNQGKKYRIVPMNQNKMPSKMSSGRDTLDEAGKSVGSGFELNTKKAVSAHLKKLGISPSLHQKLEIDPKTGSPRIGKITSFSLPSSIPGKGNTPLLDRVNVYQREVTNKKTGKKEIQRQVTTFRTVMEGQDDKWWHPSVKALNFFEEARNWAESQWQSKWLPEILQKYKGG